jgi:hypothetical protein
MTVSLSVNFPNAGATLTVDTNTTKYNAPDLVFPNDPKKKILFYNPVSRKFFQTVTITARVSSLFGFNSIVFNNSGTIEIHSLVQEGNVGDSGRWIGLYEGEFAIKFHACCCTRRWPNELGGACIAGATSCGHTFRHYNIDKTTVNGGDASITQQVWCAASVFGDPARDCLKSCDLEIPKNQSRFNIYTLDPQPNNYTTSFSNEYFLYFP